MRNKATIRALSILFALSMSAAAQPQTITGKVVGVSDGDTITALDEQKRQHKNRLDGIDAPESSQDFGSRANQSLSDLVFGKTVMSCLLPWESVNVILAVQAPVLGC